MMAKNIRNSSRMPKYDSSNNSDTNENRARRRSLRNQSGSESLDINNNSMTNSNTNPGAHRFQEPSVDLHEESKQDIQNIN